MEKVPKGHFIRCRERLFDRLDSCIRRNDGEESRNDKRGASSYIPKQNESYALGFDEDDSQFRR